MRSICSLAAGARSGAVALGLLLAWSPIDWAGSGTSAPADETLRVFSRIEEQWARALVAADRVALDKYEAPTYALVSPTGMTLTKAQADGELLNHHQRFESMVISAVQAWRNGDLAVVTGHASTKESYLGHDTSGEFEFTDIFRRYQGHWLAVHAQLTRVAGPGG